MNENNQPLLTPEPETSSIIHTVYHITIMIDDSFMNTCATSCQVRNVWFLQVKAVGLVFGLFTPMPPSPRNQKNKIGLVVWAQLVNPMDGLN